MTTFEEAKTSLRIPKIGIVGPAGAGKTKSSLELMTGLLGEGKKIALEDSENYSSTIYANEYKFFVNNISDKQITPKLIKADMEAAHKAGFGGIILDSITPAWEYLLDLSNKLDGNSFQNWGKTLTPIQRDFIKFILNFPIPIICTIRQDVQYVIEQDERGKMVPKKVGLKPQQGKNLDYELDIVFNIDKATHKASIDKCRYTPINKYFESQGGEVLLSKEVGQFIRKIIKNEPDSD